MARIDEPPSTTNPQVPQLSGGQGGKESPPASATASTVGVPLATYAAATSRAIEALAKQHQSLKTLFPSATTLQYWLPKFRQANDAMETLQRYQNQTLGPTVHIPDSTEMIAARAALQSQKLLEDQVELAKLDLQAMTELITYTKDRDLERSKAEKARDRRQTFLMLLTLFAAVATLIVTWRTRVDFSPVEQPLQSMNNKLEVLVDVAKQSILAKPNRAKVDRPTHVVKKMPGQFNEK